MRTKNAWIAPRLDRKVAVVTGASRSVGRRHRERPGDRRHRIPSLFGRDGQNALHHAVGFESGIDRRTLEKLDQCLR
jgi:hypothetical protein